MKVQLTPRILSVVLLVVIAPLAAILIIPSHPVATTQVVTENIMNSAFNSSIWKTFQQGNGPSVSVTNQKLIVTIPANSTNDPTIGGFGAGIGSLCLLRGDFDMQVAFQLLVWPNLSGVRVGLGPSLGGHGAGGTPFAVERDSFSIFDSVQGEYYVTHLLDGVNGINPASDLAGSLRITRTGGYATGYFMNDSKWTQIHTGPVVTSDVGFGLAAWSHDSLFSHQAAKVAFGNFTLNSGQLDCPTLYVTPNTGPVGTLVTVTGKGFPTAQSYNPIFSTVAVTFDDMSIGSTTNAGGSFTFAFNIPLAQAGVHWIKATDFATGTNASTTFQVTAAQSALSMSLTVGTVYFPGDTAVANLLVISNGIPVLSSGLHLNLTLTRPDNSRLGLNATALGEGLFKVSYQIPKTALLGTYLVVAAAHGSGIGDGSTLATFEVKLPWLSAQGPTLAIAGAASMATVGIALVSWRKGYLKRSSKDPFQT
ncbi:MAG TPA: hypothetical protein VNA15_07375 [Candidatus Angelobacter sp.]|nr:hypothetical protein [Candidatus Angelobacter sp.]